MSAIEYLGADTLVACTLGDAGTITTRVPGHRPFAVGDAIGLQWAATDQHLFDATSGERLVTGAAGGVAIDAAESVVAPKTAHAPARPLPGATVMLQNPEQHV